MCFSFTLLAKAENGSITGKVIDKSTKEALPGVNILIVGTNIGTSTNLNGEFIIDNLNAGIYAVQASFIGYNRITKTDVIVNSARPADILFEMGIIVILCCCLQIKLLRFQVKIPLKIVYSICTR